MSSTITAQDGHAQNTEMGLRRDHSQYTPTHFGRDGPHTTTPSLRQAHSPRTLMDVQHDCIPSIVMDNQHGYCQQDTPARNRLEYSHTECSHTPEVVVTEPEQCITPMSQPSNSPGRFYHTANLSAGAYGSIPRAFMDVAAAHRVHSSLPSSSLPRAPGPRQYHLHSPPNPMGPNTPQDTPPIPFAHHHPYYSGMHSNLYNKEPLRHQYAQISTPTHVAQRSASHMLSPTQIGRDHHQDPNELLHEVSSMRLEHTGPASGNPINDNPFRGVRAQCADLTLVSVSQAPTPQERSEDYIRGHHGIVAHGHA